MVPLCPSRGLLAPGFSCPGGPEVRGSTQGLPSSCSSSGPCPQSLGLRSPGFLGIFLLRPTLHVKKPTQPPSESKPTPLPPKPMCTSDTDTGQESNPSPALRGFVAWLTPAPTPLSALSFGGGSRLRTTDVFQRRSETHLEFPLPRRPPAGRPNRLFIPTSRKGEVSDMWESRGQRDLGQTHTVRKEMQREGGTNSSKTRKQPNLLIARPKLSHPILPLRRRSPSGIG